jgi:hypothetical protein
MTSSEELERKIQEGAKELLAEYERRKKERCAVCGMPAHPDHHQQGR